MQYLSFPDKLWHQTKLSMVAELGQEVRKDGDPKLNAALIQFRRDSRGWRRPFPLKNIVKPDYNSPFRRLGVNPAWILREIRSLELIKKVW